MTERLLQFIWQFQYFNAKHLSTTVGEPVQVIHAGSWNHHQGPDFSDARVKISDRVWAGNVELHVRASDWRRHAHDLDENYSNVILHVVWIDDDEEGTRLPTVELEHRVSVLLLDQYQSWMNSQAFIPCAGHLQELNRLMVASCQERLLIERLESRYSQLLQMLESCRFHWEETAWRWLAISFGQPVNAAAFEELARSVPFRLLQRHRGELVQLEALLMGQAGLLDEEEPADEYQRLLRREYVFYARKYGLQPIHSPVHFLRMRPAAFPTVRLAQLAMLVHRSPHLCGQILEAEQTGALRKLFLVDTSEYWHRHYHFGRAAESHVKTVGAQMVNHLIINMAAPLIFAYGCFHRTEQHMQRAIDWLGASPAERNAVTRGFAKLGVVCRWASQSQALAELKSHYCDQRRCLDCMIGNAVLKRVR